MSGPDLSSSDVLQRAAAALRAAHDGQREGSGFTRARILAAAAERRRPRLRRWLVLAPLGSALLVGSAWAQSTGSWPQVWRAVTTVLPFLDEKQPEPLERRQRAPAAPREQPPLSPPDEVSPPAAEPPAELPREEPTLEEPAIEKPAATEPTPAPAPAPLPRPGRARRAPADSVAAPEPAPDLELRRFRAAHELHVQGQPRAAIAAYREYLRAHPDGRFVPEARYNSALDFLKLGEHDLARQLLEPFAAGAYGGYRRGEAQRLLQALDQR